MRAYRQLQVSEFIIIGSRLRVQLELCGSTRQGAEAGESGFRKWVGGDGKLMEKGGKGWLQGRREWQIWNGRRRRQVKKTLGI